MKILVIDDNNEILDVLRDLLESGGYDVDTCRSGRESLELITKNNFDVILLDITMPEFSGLDVIKNLKDTGHFEKNSIILFTAASVSDDAADEWIKTGVKGFLRKPFEPGKLFEAINEASMT